MKKILLLAIVFQVYLVTRCPAGLGSESLLAAQAMMHGLMPYRDFKIHIGPLVPLIYFALFSISPLAWCSFVFVLANIMTAYGIHQLACKAWNRDMTNLSEYPMVAGVLYLIFCPFFGGNEMYVETIMAMFGVWALYFAATDRKWLAGLMVLCAVLTKQTGIIYGVCLL